MVYLKKLVFAPLFLAFLGYSIYFFNLLLNSYADVFSLSGGGIYNYAFLSTLIILASMFFVVFASLAQDWKLVGPVSLLGAAFSFVFLPQPLSVVMAVTLLISFLITFLMLENNLKTYVTFQATTLLNPSIKSLILFMILVFSFGYFLSINSKIQKEGFEIPDSLIDFSLKFAAPESLNLKGEKYIAQAPQLSSEQIQLLKQNPELLKQYGIDPKMLDSLETTQSNTKAPAPKKSNSSIQVPTAGNLGNDFIKNLLKDQFQNLLKPYLGIIPAILAVLFFVTVQFISSVLSILVSPIIFLIFYILEKSGFITFSKEMREVKKIVV